MTSRRIGCVMAAVAALVGFAAPAPAQGFLEAPGFQPRVPVSSFARPAGWFDPSRLRIGSTFSVGTGFSGGSSALQVTSFSYQFAKPAWLEVSLGNSFGGDRAGGNAMFLEGLRFGFRPSANTVFQVQFQDVRSPLQLSRDPFARGW